VNILYGTNELFHNIAFTVLATNRKIYERKEGYVIVILPKAGRAIIFDCWRHNENIGARYEVYEKNFIHF
jgi:hypothetical protein